MSTAARVGRGIGRTLKWALIVGALLIVIIIIAAVVGLGNAADNSDASSKQVSPAEYAAIHQGDSRAAVISTIGAKPESSDSTAVGTITTTCIYYGVISSKGTYQFCFQNGRLVSKSRF